MKLITRLSPAILPLAVRWAERQEATILARGVPLSPQGMADAREMGVIHPEKIRLLKVEYVPMPFNTFLRFVAKVSGLLSPHTSGMALRYGLFIRQDYWGHRHIIAHECVHTGQYERLNGFGPFLRQYVQECLEYGYPQAPLEQEAIMRSAQIATC
jgi:hypothetical protein